MSDTLTETYHNFFAKVTHYMPNIGLIDLQINIFINIFNKIFGTALV